MTATTTPATTLDPATTTPTEVRASAAADGPGDGAPRYVEPGWFTRNVFNRSVAWLTRRGISVWGSRVLEVRGRRSGEPRRTPVNLLTVDGRSYLVAPRGTTQWVRNLRVAGEGRLLLGRRSQPFTSEEVADADKAAVLRPYLQRWKAEVGVFFDGVDASASDEELVAIGPKHPVFLLSLGEETR
jgi:deazaflavin-dependent oxidoreductase (nitroreductase family)